MEAGPTTRAAGAGRSPSSSPDSKLTKLIADGLALSKGGKAHIEQARALFRSSFPVPLHESTYKRVESDDGLTLAVVFDERGKRIAGAAIYGTIEGEAEEGKSRYLFAIAVEPMRRDEGVGSALLQFILRDISPRALELHVQADNDGAIRFYQRAGFVNIETIKGYYRRLKCNDAVCMRSTEIGPKSDTES